MLVRRGAVASAGGGGSISSSFLLSYSSIYFLSLSLSFLFRLQPDYNPTLTKPLFFRWNVVDDLQDSYRVVWLAAVYIINIVGKIRIRYLIALDEALISNGAKIMN